MCMNSRFATGPELTGITPHPHGMTGPQIYGGLAWLFLVSDEKEKAGGLPTGEYDLSLVI